MYIVGICTRARYLVTRRRSRTWFIVIVGRRWQIEEAQVSRREEWQDLYAIPIRMIRNDPSKIFLMMKCQNFRRISCDNDILSAYV